MNTTLDNLSGTNTIRSILLKSKVEYSVINRDIKKENREKIFGNTAPDVQNNSSASVKIDSSLRIPLLEIYPSALSPFEHYVKRFFDIVVSSFVLIFFFPLYIVLGLLIVFSSKGPLLFTQERIGKNGKPFIMYKFRSMTKNAEKDHPKLSNRNDERITLLGKFMRKHKLDELPQFYNVLLGEMSVVGPRPERRYYIDKIVKKAPHYYYLTEVKPGITSLGQIKFGYAETVDEMIERLKFDVIYIENISFSLDIKILYYTILTVIRGGTR